MSTNFNTVLLKMSTVQIIVLAVFSVNMLLFMFAAIFFIATDFNIILKLTAMYSFIIYIYNFFAVVIS